MNQNLISNGKTITKGLE